MKQREQVLKEAAMKKGVIDCTDKQCFVLAAAAAATAAPVAVYPTSLLGTSITSMKF